MRGGPLLEVRDLAVSFDVEGEARVVAVDGLDFTIHPGQTLAIVGESGCGKTITALSVLRLVPRPAGRIDRGAILLEGRDLLQLTEAEMLDVRGGEIAMIFQEPRGSLNPVMSVGDQIVEAIRRHQKVSRPVARAAAAMALRDVGIPRPEASFRAYPHELSGGMCQRAMIAMALACRPKLLLADEPTTALDVTIRAQILDLLRDLQARTGMAIVLITHDLGVVAKIADVVCIMYAGRAVEYASVVDLFDRPYHPYTQGLFTSIPRIGQPRRRLRTVQETLADPAAFTRLRGYELGVVPWWPTMKAPPDVAAGAGHRLVEIDPGHLVGCWCTDYVARRPAPRPDLAFRRPVAGQLEA
jgi:ABC-type dipeptide/oligopeptide/nickel transport system ATPase component